MGDSTPEGVELVTHEQIFPEPVADYLPTYFSGGIEMNLHRVSGLAERFLYFNDDMFLCRPTRFEDFYARDGRAIMAADTQFVPSIEAMAAYTGARNVPGGTYYFSTMHHMCELIRRRLGAEPVVPWHGVNAFEREHFLEVERLLPDEVTATRKLRYWRHDTKGRALHQSVALLFASARGLVESVESKPLLYATETPETLDAFEQRYARDEAQVMCLQNCTATRASVEATRRVLDWLLDE
jgi:hypothetical protein